MNLLDGASPLSGFPVLDGIGQHRCVRDAMELIEPVRLNTVSLITWLNGLNRKELAVLCARSVERTSHFKWFLGESVNGYVVWLHEYKAAMLPDAVGSFAASVHNHRYSFVSQVLTGSLSVSDFSLDPIKQFPVFSRARIIPAQSTYFLSSDEIHRIDATAPSTCTLVVQGPPERPYSRVFDLPNATFQDIYDLPARLPELISVLSGPASSIERAPQGRPGRGVLPNDG
jgi:hypothetical protein